MATQFLVPRLGEGVEEVTISKWLKREGEYVEELQPLLEVNTDKVDTEIPSPVSGTVLKIQIAEGETARVGAVLAWIGQPGEQLAEGASLAAPAAHEQAMAMDEAASPAAVSPPQPASRPGGLGFISPVVSKMAMQHGIDLSQVVGSGQGGRITKKDVLAYLAATPGAAATPVSSAPKAEAPPAQPGVELLPLTTVRRAIAEHMVLSKRVSPHVTTVMEADLSRVVAHRQAHKAAFARSNTRLTFTIYFAAAAVSALKAHPIVNSSWSDQGIRLQRAINLGIATSLGDAGLIVPVVKQAEQYSLLGLAGQINDLTQRARDRQLKPEDVQGGTFTITNHGVSGSLFAAPIINQPQCAILGVGAIQKRVVVVADTSGADAIAIRPMVYLTLTFDHRILDGVQADGFLGKVVELLQNWESDD